MVFKRELAEFFYLKLIGGGKVAILIKKKISRRNIISIYILVANFFNLEHAFFMTKYLSAILKTFYLLQPYFFAKFARLEG